MVINSAHPAFITAYTMKSELYHQTRCLINTLLIEAEIEGIDEKMFDFFSTLNAKNPPDE